MQHVATLFHGRALRNRRGRERDICMRLANLLVCHGGLEQHAASSEGFRFVVFLLGEGARLGVRARIRMRISLRVRDGARAGISTRVRVGARVRERHRHRHRRSRKEEKELKELIKSTRSTPHSIQLPLKCRTFFASPLHLHLTENTRAYESHLLGLRSILSRRQRNRRTETCL